MALVDLSLFSDAPTSHTHFQRGPQGVEDQPIPSQSVLKPLPPIPRRRSHEGGPLASLDSNSPHYVLECLKKPKLESRRRTSKPMLHGPIPKIRLAREPSAYAATSKSLHQIFPPQVSSLQRRRTPAAPGLTLSTPRGSRPACPLTWLPEEQMWLAEVPVWPSHTRYTRSAPGSATAYPPRDRYNHHQYGPPGPAPDAPALTSLTRPQSPIRSQFLSLMNATSSAPVSGAATGDDALWEYEREQQLRLNQRRDQDRLTPMFQQALSGMTFGDNREPWVPTADGGNRQRTAETDSMGSPAESWHRSIRGELAGSDGDISQEDEWDADDELPSPAEASWRESGGLARSVSVGESTIRRRRTLESWITFDHPSDRWPEERWPEERVISPMSPDEATFTRSSISGLSTGSSTQ